MKGKKLLALPALLSASVAMADVATVNTPGDGFLALRSEPSSQQGVRLLKIPHGTTLVLGECVSVSASQRWCKTHFGYRTGWVLDRYVVRQHKAANRTPRASEYSPSQGDPTRKAILDAIRAEYAAPVVFIVHDIRVRGNWAWAEVVGTVNGQPEYEGEGYVLQHAQGRWRVMDSVNASDPDVVAERYWHLRSSFPNAPIPDA